MHSSRPDPILFVLFVPLAGAAVGRLPGFIGGIVFNEACAYATEARPVHDGDVYHARVLVCRDDMKENGFSFEDHSWVEYH